MCHTFCSLAHPSLALSCLRVKTCKCCEQCCYKYIFETPLSPQSWVIIMNTQEPLYSFPIASLLFSVLPEVHKDPSFSTSLPTLTIFCFVLCISFCDYLMLVMWMFSYTLLAICSSVEKHLKLCARFFCIGLYEFCC